MQKDSRYVASSFILLAVATSTVFQREVGMPR